MTDRAEAWPIYLETNFFIKAVEGTAEVAAPPRKLIEVLRKRSNLAVTSEITLAEVLAPPRRPDALPLSVKRRAYLHLLVWSRLVNLHPVSRDILYETADLRSVTRMKLPDAIHLATAIEKGCRFIVSGDSDFDRLPDGMTRIAPSETGIDLLLRELA